MTAPTFGGFSPRDYHRMSSTTTTTGISLLITSSRTTLPRTSTPRESRHSPATGSYVVGAASSPSSTKPTGKAYCSPHGSERWTSSASGSTIFVTEQPHHFNPNTQIGCIAACASMLPTRTLARSVRPMFVSGLQPPHAPRLNHSFQQHHRPRRRLSLVQARDHHL